MRRLFKSAIPGSEKKRNPREKGTSSTSTSSTTPTTITETNVRKPRAILAGMKAFAEHVNTIGVEGLRMAFSKLQQKGPHPSDMAATVQKHNKAKCRYFDIPCLDETRVVLKPWPNTTGDFIHANWVSHELIDNKFICTQAPLDSTVGDFWRMLWQEKVELILMLCRVTEAGKPKCAQYWPNASGETKTFCGITVKNETVRNKDPDIWGTDLLVSYGDEQRKVSHYQWITWPDKFVPQQLVVPFILLSLARSNKHPTIIHCSAGIGRTGTLVALEVFIRALMQGSDLSISDVIWSIRSQRSKSVQTEEQFLYMHYIVIQRLVNKGILSDRIASNFCRDYEHFYFSRTHTVQVPLPVFVRKHLTTQTRRRSVERVSLVNNDEEANKLSDRRAKCLAISEETLAALRMSFNKRSKARKVAQIEERTVAKEVQKVPDLADVEKAIKQTIEVVRQFQASNKLSDTIRQQYEQAIQALQSLCFITEEAKGHTPANTVTIAVASTNAVKVAASPPPITAMVTASKVSDQPSSQPKAFSDAKVPAQAGPIKVESTVCPVPVTPSSAPSRNPPIITANTNLEKGNEKGVETKLAESCANMSVEENGAKGGNDDEDFSASYIFMQPEWANIYPAERRNRSELIEEHYAHQEIEKNMDNSSK